MKKIYIENNVNSFKDFHDSKWFDNLFSLVDGSEIVDEVDDFSAHWWGASRAFVLPWLFVDRLFKSNPVQSKQEYWNEFQRSNAFNASLWKIAEGAYCSIYYAYENLVVNLLNKRRSTPVRVTDKKFYLMLRDEVGEPLADKIWNESSVAVAREIRNCLVHRGGHASPKLLKMKPLPRIENKEILISATNVRSLYSDFKPRVMRLVQHYCK